jgi:hypothetical protein
MKGNSEAVVYVMQPNMSMRVQQYFIYFVGLIDSVDTSSSSFSHPPGRGPGPGPGIN